MIQPSRYIGGVTALIAWAPWGAAVSAQQPVQAPETAVTAFVGVNVVPMDRERVLPDQTVIVRGEHIVALGPAKRVAVPAGAVQVDGRGKYLLPGLADMHVHIGYAETQDTTITADLLYTYVANGVTTVRDMHSGGRTLPEKMVEQGFGAVPGAYRLELRRRLARGELLGPHLYLAGDPDLTAPATAARTVAELKADGYDFLKIAFSKQWPGPDWRPTYDSIITVARRVGLPVVGHVPTGIEDVTKLGAPWVSTEHLYGYMEYVLGLNGRWRKDEGGLLNEKVPTYADTAAWMRPGYQLDQSRLRRLAQALRRAKVWTCPTLSVTLGVGVGRPSEAQDQNVSASGLETRQQKARRVVARYGEFDLQILRGLRDAEAGLLLGTDVIGDPFAIHHELAMLVKDAGFTPYQALAMGTRNVAEFLGTLDSTGTVAVGKRADLVLLAGNPLEDIGYTAGPAGVMLGGRWLPRAELEARLHAMVLSPKGDPARTMGNQFYETVKESLHSVWRH